MYIRIGERPHALLNENSGTSHEQKRRSTGQPKREEATRSGTEKRRAVEVLTLSALLSHRRCCPSCRRTRTTTCPKKRPVEGHSSCWLLPVAVVCHIPMKQVCLER